MGEAVGIGQVAVDAWLEDVRATALGALEALLAGEFVQRAANGDQAAAVVTREVPFRRKAIARPVRPLIQR